MATLNIGGRKDRQWVAAFRRCTLDVVRRADPAAATFAEELVHALSEFELDDPIGFRTFFAKARRARQASLEDDPPTFRCEAGPSGLLCYGGPVTCVLDCGRTVTVCERHMNTWELRAAQ